MYVAIFLSSDFTLTLCQLKGLHSPQQGMIIKERFPTEPCSQISILSMWLFDMLVVLVLPRLTWYHVVFLKTAHPTEHCSSLPGAASLPMQSRRWMNALTDRHCGKRRRNTFPRVCGWWLWESKKIWKVESNLYWIALVSKTLSRRPWRRNDKLPSCLAGNQKLQKTAMTECTLYVKRLADLALWNESIIIKGRFSSLFLLPLHSGFFFFCFHKNYTIKRGCDLFRGPWVMGW